MMQSLQHGQPADHDREVLDAHRAADQIMPGTDSDTRKISPLNSVHELKAFVERTHLTAPQVERAIDAAYREISRVTHALTYPEGINAVEVLALALRENFIGQKRFDAEESLRGKTAVVSGGSLAGLREYIRPEPFIEVLREKFPDMSFYGLERYAPATWFDLFGDALHKHYGGNFGVTRLFNVVLEAVGHEHNDELAQIFESRYNTLRIPKLSPTDAPQPASEIGPSEVRPSIALLVYSVLHSGRSSLEVTAFPPEVLTEAGAILKKLDYETEVKTARTGRGSTTEFHFKESGARAQATQEQRSTEIVDAVLRDARGNLSGTVSVGPAERYSQDMVQHAVARLASQYEYACTFRSDTWRGTSSWHIEFAETGQRAVETRANQSRDVVQEVLAAVSAGKNSVSMYPISRCPDDAMSAAQLVLNRDHDFDIEHRVLTGHSGTYRYITISEIGDRRAATLAGLADGLVTEVLSSARNGSSSVSIYPESRCPPEALELAKRTLQSVHGYNLSYRGCRGHSGSFTLLEFEESGNRLAATQRRQVDEIVSAILAAVDSRKTSVHFGASAYSPEVRKQAMAEASRRLEFSSFREEPGSSLTHGATIGILWGSQTSAATAADRTDLLPIEQEALSLNAQNVALFKIQRIESHELLQHVARGAQVDQNAAVRFLDQILQFSNLLGGAGSIHVRYVQRLRDNTMNLRVGVSVYQGLGENLPRF